MSAATLKLMTYNIHCGVGTDGAYDLQRLGGVIRRAAPDLVCLQEIESNTVERQVRKFSVRHADDQPSVLAQAAGLGFSSFAGFLRAYFDGRSGGSCDSGEVLTRCEDGSAAYGNAVLSRFAIIEERTLHFEPEAPPASDELVYMDREEQPRGARAILVDVAPEAPGKQFLWLVCTHLSHKFCSAEQRRQAQQLVRWVDALVEDSKVSLSAKPAVILCGDLNAPPFAPWSGYAVISEDKRWKDLWKAKGTWFHQATFPAKSAPSVGIRIDHIFALSGEDVARVDCGAIRVVGGAADDGVASDHLSVLVELVISQP